MKSESVTEPVSVTVAVNDAESDTVLRLIL
jgi:hypothetical protein